MPMSARPVILVRGAATTTAMAVADLDSCFGSGRRVLDQEAIDVVVHGVLNEFITGLPAKCLKIGHGTGVRSEDVKVKSWRQKSAFGRGGVLGSTSSSRASICAVRAKRSAAAVGSW